MKNPKEEPKQDRTCTHNCSVVCGECQIFEPKQETLEEAAERLTQDYNGNLSEKLIAKTFITVGAKWQQEQEQNKYSEEEVLKFTQKILMQYKFGNTNIEQLDLLKETLEQFKNK